MSWVSLLLSLLVVSAGQGTAVQVVVPDEAGVKAVKIVWNKKEVPAVLARGRWTTVLGVDLDVRTGRHPAELVLTMMDGRIERRPAAVDVVAKKYPTTELTVEDKYVDLSKADLERANRETKETEGFFAVTSGEKLWETPFTIPIPGETGTNFGHRRVFNGQPRAPHAGADLRAKTGTTIHATNRGRVVLAKDLFFTGNTVILDHGLGVYSLYAHMSRIDVKVGDTVVNGQPVGLSGATGRVTGPHLHWGMRVQGARVDPFTLVGTN